MKKRELRARAAVRFAKLKLPGQVAQLVERSPEKAGVGGSIPSLATRDSVLSDRQTRRFIPILSKSKRSTETRHSVDLRVWCLVALLMILAQSAALKWEKVGKSIRLLILLLSHAGR